MLGVCRAQSAQALRKEFEAKGLRVYYVLEKSQGLPIVGTCFVYHESLADTFASLLALQHGCE